MKEVALVMLVASMLIAVFVGFKYFRWRMRCREHYHKCKDIPLQVGQVWGACCMVEEFEIVAVRPGRYVTLRFFGKQGDNMWVEAIADWEKRRDFYSLFLVATKNANISPFSVVH